MLELNSVKMILAYLSLLYSSVCVCVCAKKEKKGLALRDLHRWGTRANKQLCFRIFFYSNGKCGEWVIWWWAIASLSLRYCHVCKSVQPTISKCVRAMYTVLLGRIGKFRKKFFRLPKGRLRLRAGQHFISRLVEKKSHWHVPGRFTKTWVSKSQLAGQSSLSCWSSSALALIQFCRV